MLTKMKKVCVKMQKFNKQKMVWWIVTFPQNLALIRLTASEKRVLRMDAGCLHHGISSAVTVKQS